MNHEDIDMERLKEACRTLGEYFETVQIFCTRVSDEEADEGGTVSCQHGTGNWFARKGQVTEWVLKQDENTRKEARENL